MRVSGQVVVNEEVEVEVELPPAPPTGNQPPRLRATHPATPGPAFAPLLNPTDGMDSESSYNA